MSSPGFTINNRYTHSPVDSSLADAPNLHTNKFIYLLRKIFIIIFMCFTNNEKGITNFHEFLSHSKFLKENKIVVIDGQIHENSEFVFRGNMC
mgnify:CR=1 FL=1